MKGYAKGEIWGTRFTQFFRWRTDDGFESISTLDFERDVAENFFYRTTLKGKRNQDNTNISPSSNPPTTTSGIILFLESRIGKESGESGSFLKFPPRHLFQKARTGISLPE